MTKQLRKEVASSAFVSQLGFVEDTVATVGFDFAPGRFSTAEGIEIIETAQLKASRFEPNRFRFGGESLAELGCDVDALAQRVRGYVAEENDSHSDRECEDVLDYVDSLLLYRYDVNRLNASIASNIANGDLCTGLGCTVDDLEETSRRSSVSCAA